MTLTDTDVELIRASWIPARSDPIGAGVLLFKGLFTKFPDYLRFFNQFADLDLERMHENKRLIKHAVKIIDTVTFLVDSVGDPAKAELLNEALSNLVKSHLRKRIGHKEFYNLGLVLIDFICDLNNRRIIDGTTTPLAADLRGANNGLSKSGNASNNNARGGGSSASSSQDSETMTIALDKIRASLLPSSSSEDENLLARSIEIHRTNEEEPVNAQIDSLQSNHRIHEQRAQSVDNNENGLGVRRSPSGLKLDPNLIVAAWKELYGIILRLVRDEEGRV